MEKCANVDCVLLLEVFVQGMVQQEIQMLFFSSNETSRPTIVYVFVLQFSNYGECSIEDILYPCGFDCEKIYMKMHLCNVQC